jgi:hypothetical protein
VIDHMKSCDVRLGCDGSRMNSAQSFSLSRPNPKFSKSPKILRLRRWRGLTFAPFPAPPPARRLAAARVKGQRVKVYQIVRKSWRQQAENRS